MTRVLELKTPVPTGAGEHAMRVLDAWRALEIKLRPIDLSGMTIQMLLWLHGRASTSPMPTGALCTALDAPRSTVLRWIAALTAAGLVIQTYDEADRRLTLLALSPRARTMVEDWLTAIGA